MVSIARLKIRLSTLLLICIAIFFGRLSLTHYWANINGEKDACKEEIGFLYLLLSVFYYSARNSILRITFDSANVNVLTSFEVFDNLRDAIKMLLQWIE